MVLVTLLWSSAGVVTRHLEAAQSFEVTFWRSAFNALALAVLLTLLRGPGLWPRLLRSPWPVWVSGLCWAVMFTAFMFAIMLTSVARVLITMAAAPLATALIARVALGQQIAPRTWAAIVLAGAGIAWMFGGAALGGTQADVLGVLVAAGVPLAAAINWTVLQHVARSADPRGASRPPADPAGVSAEPVPTPGQDMLPAVLIGAVLSAAVMLPFSLPSTATAGDLWLLAGLGVFQLALPCLLAVRVSRRLPGPEIALIGLLEVVFGVLWTWLWGGETPAGTTLSGGALVLAALVGHELLALRSIARR